MCLLWVCDPIPIPCVVVGVCAVYYVPLPQCRSEPLTWSDSYHTYVRWLKKGNERTEGHYGQSIKSSMQELIHVTLAYNDYQIQAHKTLFKQFKLRKHVFEQISERWAGTGNPHLLLLLRQTKTLNNIVTLCSNCLLLV